MSQKNLNTRMISKHDTQAKWENVSDFIPYKGEIIVYDRDDNYSYERFKIGDGITAINDLPFATIQPDWSQNDENAADYVKNRTHYVESVEEIISLPETTLSLMEGGSDFVVTTPFSTPIEVGVTYKITYNGSEYNCKAQSITAGTDTATVLGNVGAMTGGTDTGEPFTVIIVPDELVSEIGCYAMVEVTDSAETVTISISAIKETIKILDPKYLANNKKPHNYLTTDENGDAKWEQMLTWAETSVVEVLPETEFTFDDSGESGITDPIARHPADGNVCVVTFDGVEYETVATELNDNGLTGIVMGNLGKIGMGPDTGEPFVIIIPSEEAVASMGGITFVVGALDSGLGSAMVSVKENVKVYHKISQEFLPTPDWNAREGEEGYIANKTHYAYSGIVEVLSECTVTESDDSAMATPLSEALVEGTQYTVTYNGNEYNTTATSVDLDGITAICMGNVGKMMDNGTDTGEPFVFIEVPAALAAQMGQYWMVNPFDEATSITIKVEYDGEVIKRIDQKFLPQYDWNASKGEDGYIANRTHYVNVTDVEIMPETSITVNSGENIINVSTNNFTAGANCIVTWNGVDYECTIQSGVNSAVEGMITAYVGNGSMLGGIQTDDPFLLAQLTPTGAAQVGGSHVLYVSDGSTTATMKIVEPAGTVHKIDLMYLPDIPCNLNFVNGAATGSVRTSGAASDGNTIVDGATYYLGQFAFAEGQDSHASGEASHAEGYSTKAYGRHAHAEGNMTRASGDNSHTEGSSTTASGHFSHAEGKGVTASGSTSHAEGASTIASGAASHAEGHLTIASGDDSHAEGYYTIASGKSSHAEGGNFPYSITLSGENDAIIYTYSQTSRVPKIGYLIQLNNIIAEITNVDEENSAITLSQTLSSITLEGASATMLEGKASGEYSHTEGLATTASGDYSHAEGNRSFASGDSSHAEGRNTKALNISSHAEGSSTIASEIASHAEGHSTIASGHSSHAEGTDTTANGHSSHAEGNSTTANGHSSHAEGYYTIAASTAQHVQGQHNIEDNSAIYAHIVGNGTSTVPSNAHTLDWSGNAWYAGDVLVGGTSQEDAKVLATKEYVDGQMATAGPISSVNGKTGEVVLSATDVNAVPTTRTINGKALSSNITLSATDVNAVPTTRTINGKALSSNITFTASDVSAVPTSRTVNGKALSSNITLAASDVGADAAGTAQAKINELYIKNGNNNSLVSAWAATESDTYSLGERAIALGNNSEARGTYSFAEGYLTKANGNYSHAEGYNSTASGDISHAEGVSTFAAGNYSHVEGYYTDAYGESAHAEGSQMNAIGDDSHAEGTGGMHGIMYLTGDANAVTYTYTFPNDAGSQYIKVGYVVRMGTTTAVIKQVSETTITMSNTLSSTAITEENAIILAGVAYGSSSHAEGWFNTATGNYSHAEGYDVIAKGNYQHVQGKYNIADTNKYAHIVGNGSNTERSNAHTLDWQGNAWYQGNVYVGGASQDDADVLATESYVDEKVAAKVDKTITVNGKALSSNIILSASDVGALPSTTVIPSIEGLATETYVNEKASTKVDKTTTINGKALSSSIALSANDVNADPSGSANTALANAKSYTDTKISDLINSAPTTLDTLGEIATAMAENEDVVAALEESIGTKANASDLTSHTGNKSNPHSVTLSQLGVTATATELNYVDGVTSNVQTQLNAKVPTDRTVNGKALSSNVILSASDVSAVSTATKIGLSGGVTGTTATFGNNTNVTIPITDIKESYMSWGGKNLLGKLSPFDDIVAGSVTNCFAFLPLNGVTAEYTRDGGTTWTPTSVTSGLFLPALSGSGPSITKPYTTNDKIRITIDNSICQQSSSLKKLLFDLYCIGVEAQVVVEYFYNNNLRSTQTFALSGNWNSIAASYTFYPAYKLRFTFEITNVSEHNNPGFSIDKIVGIGETISGSNMAKTGELYTYDENQNATFPAQVSATQFTENGKSLASKYVAQTRTINGKALTSNITLSANDIGASTETYVNEKVAAPRDYIALTDQVTGKIYRLTMENGSLITTLVEGGE